MSKNRYAIGKLYLIAALLFLSAAGWAWRSAAGKGGPKWFPKWGSQKKSGEKWYRARDVTGLRPGTEVKVAGYTVGEVTEVSIDGEASTEAFPVFKVKVSIDVDKCQDLWSGEALERLTEHTTAWVISESMVSPNIIRLVPAPRDIAMQQYLADSKGKNSLPLIEKERSLIDKAAEVADIKAPILAAVGQFYDASASFNNAIASFNRPASDGDKTKTKLDNIIAGIQTIEDAFTAPTKGIHNEDSTVSKDIANKLQLTLDSLSNDAKEFSGSEKTPSSDFQRTMRHLEKITGTFESKGSLGKNLDSTLESLRSAADSLKAASDSLKTASDSLKTTSDSLGGGVNGVKKGFFGWVLNFRTSKTNEQPPQGSPPPRKNKSGKHTPAAPPATPPM